MDNFKKKFIEEATEHLSDLEKALLDLEKDTNDKELIEKVFRIMHSLKGGGAMFGFEKISEFTHNLENLYDLVRNDQKKIDRKLLDLTLASVDHLYNLLDEEQANSNEASSMHVKLSSEIAELINDELVPSTGTETTNQARKQGGISTYYIHFVPNENIFDNGTNPLFLLDELQGLGKSLILPKENHLPDLENINPIHCYFYWDIFISTSEEINSISDVFIFVEDECELEIHRIWDDDLIDNKSFINEIKQQHAKGTDFNLNSVKESVSKHVTAGNDTKQKSEKSNGASGKEHTISSIRVSSDKLDQLMNLVSELVTTQARLSLFAENDTTPELIGIAENVQKLSRQLRDTAFSIVLIPIENMLTRFQRLIRDLSKELGKEVSFVAEGTETELDKTIIESLTDPMMHILRNSMDHGIELPHARENTGKSRQGKILLKAFYSGANVVIQVIDDGAGIDPDMIREKAIRKGIVNKDVNLNKKEILDLVFLPGFSTAKTVTDVSGRGVGMDVVKRKIADIRGEVEIDSDFGKGTTITIKLPLTLSIIDGLLVNVDNSFYIIPLTSVDKIYATEHGNVYNTFNNVVVLDNEQVSYFNLRTEFDCPESTKKLEEVVVVKYEDKRVGLVVDEVVGEYQAVLKPLGKHYKDQEIISGATILGDGTVALVMDTNKAIKQFSKNNQITEEV